MAKSRGIRVRRGTRLIWLRENEGKHRCQCGCGGVIPLKANHFNVDIPRYLHGHNSKVSPPNPRKPKPPARPCECGCGDFATPGSRFIYGHGVRGHRMSDATREKMRQSKLGAKNPRYGKVGTKYNGGLTRHRTGYLLRWAPDHPYAIGSGYVMAHRLLVEEHLRQGNPTDERLIEINGTLYLRREFEVHHDNEVKDDNRLENLRVLTGAEHKAIHQDALTRAQQDRTRRLSDADVEQVRKMRRAGAHIADIAAALDISRSYAYRLARGERRAA